MYLLVLLQIQICQVTTGQLFSITEDLKSCQSVNFSYHL